MLKPCIDCGSLSPYTRCRSCSGKIAAHRRLNKLGPSTKPCPDCGQPIKMRSGRCPSCAMRHKWQQEDIRERIVQGLVQSHPQTANRTCVDCGAALNHPGSKRCNTCSAKEKWQSPTHREKVSTAVRHTLKTSPKIAAVRANNPYFQRGSEHPRYLGGTKQGRSSAAYDEWRIAVLMRDHNRCIECGREDELTAHHIKSYAKHPDLRFNVENGVTLCFDCHCKQHAHHIPKPRFTKRPKA